MFFPGVHRGLSLFMSVCVCVCGWAKDDSLRGCRGCTLFPGKTQCMLSFRDRLRGNESHFLVSYWQSSSASSAVCLPPFASMQKNMVGQPRAKQNLVFAYSASLIFFFFFSWPIFVCVIIVFQDHLKGSMFAPKTVWAPRQWRHERCVRGIFKVVFWLRE